MYMVFPLSIFLYIYLVFLFIWFVFSLVGVYHIIKFSQINLISFFSIIIYAGGSLVILNYSYYFISQADWSTPITFLNNLFAIGFN